MFEKFLNLFKKKKYVFYIPMGSTNELSYRLFQYYRYNFSPLFSWCKFDSIDFLLKFLLNPKTILEDEIEYKNGYCTFINSGITFKSKTDKIKETDDKDYYNLQLSNVKKEMKDHLEYLIADFKAIVNMLYKDKLLFVYTTSEKDCADKNIVKKINNLYKILEHINATPVDLLVITEKKYENLFNVENESIFVRYIENFSEYNYTSEKNDGDKQGWIKIFKEFKQLEKTEKKIALQCSF